MGHNSLRTVLENGEQRHHVVAARARDHQFIGGDNAKLGGSGSDHLYRGRAGAAGQNVNVQAMLLIRSSVESAELRIGLPVQREPDPVTLSASPQNRRVSR